MEPRNDERRCKITIKPDVRKEMRAIKVDELTDNQPHAVELDGENIVLIRKGDNVYALKDECTHEDFPLSVGRVDDTHIHCAFHGAKFKLATGERDGPPAFEDVESFPVTIVDGWVEVEL